MCPELLARLMPRMCHIWAASSAFPALAACLQCTEAELAVCGKGQFNPCAAKPEAAEDGAQQASLRLPVQHSWPNQPCLVGEWML